MKTSYFLAAGLAMLISVGAVAQTPKDTLKTCYDNFLEYQVQGANNENAGYMRLALKSGYFRYGLVAFDMSKMSSIRDKVELALYVYSSTSDDFFKGTVQDTYPIGVYGLKRNPTLPTSYGRFVGTSTDDPAGDGFSIIGSYPKKMAEEDADFLGEVVVQKADQDSYVKVDVSDFVNKHINSNDTIFFFLTSNATVADKVSLYIKTMEEGNNVAPRLYLYDEQPIALMQGGRDIFVGEKDSVFVFFPATAQPPFSITYTEGDKPVQVNGIQSMKYGFEVAPQTDITYTLTHAEDANGELSISGSASFVIKTPTAVISGKNKIYTGSSSSLKIDFQGIPPFSFSMEDDKGNIISQTNILTSSYVLAVSPENTFTYTLLSASDANNTNIVTSGDAQIVVMDIPEPMLGENSDQWSIVYGEEFGAAELQSTDWSITKGQPEVEDDELRLYITNDGTTNVAAQVKYAHVLPTNTDLYLETKIKPINASGVSSTMFTQTYDASLSSMYKNRYGMTFPEIRYVGDKLYNLYYALDDWKTNYYIKDIDPDLDYYSVKDSLLAQTIDGYAVFGVEIRKQEIIYYLNGIEVKRASNMYGYNSGTKFIDALTAIGSAYQDVAQNAYGYYEQEDWNFLGGYTGDQMAYIMGVTIDNTLFDENAVGQYAAVDYFRIYKLKSEINTTPEVDIVFDDDLHLEISGDAVKDNGVIAVNEGSAKFDLGKNFDVGQDACYYFSTIVNKDEDGEFTISLCDAANEILAGSVIDNYNQLKTGFGSNKLYYASTVSAEPVGKKNTYYKNNEVYLLVGRIETSAESDDYMSLSLFPIMDEISEPYFYPNISGDYGHTSLNNGWDLNYKYEIGTGTISKIQLESKRATTYVQKYLLGTSFKSVLPKESFVTFAPQMYYIAKGENIDIEILLKGEAPWTITYTDGSEIYTIKDITTPTFKLAVAPEQTTHYELLSLVDGNGNDGIAFGELTVKVKSEDAVSLYPYYDSFVRADQPNVTYANEITGEVKQDAVYHRDAYLSFDISEYDTTDSIDVASLSLFFLSNDKGAEAGLSLYSVEDGMPGDIIDLCWANRPDDVNMKFLSEITVQNPGFYGVRGNWDVAKFINEKLRSGAGTVDFCIKLTSGNTSALLKWRQYAPDSLELASQFPMLELDPYHEPTAISSVIRDRDIVGISPNPVMDGYFDINSTGQLIGNFTVRVYSISGELISIPEVNHCRVQIGNMPKGIYMVEIKDEIMRYYAKLIVQ